MKTRIIKRYAIFILLLAIISACDKDSNDKPVIITVEVANITGFTALGGGEIPDNGGLPVYDRGLCWSTEENPTIDDFVASDSSAMDSYKSTLVNLIPNTVYFYRAYLENEKGVFYGEQRSFSSLDIQRTSGMGLTDIEGNTYRTVIIGGQEWMAENLRVRMFSDGTPIEYGPLDDDCEGWEDIPYYTYYNFNEGMAMAYGALYNGYTVVSGDICPPGWRVPTGDDWKVLEGFIDSQFGVGHAAWDESGRRGYDAGEKLKALSGWTHFGNGYNGTDFFGFTALPVGIRSSCGPFVGEHGITQFWTATSFDTDRLYRRVLHHDDGMVSSVPSGIQNSYSIRCMRDQNQ